MKIVNNLPSNKDYNILLKDADWGTRSNTLLESIRKYSCYAVSVYDDNNKIIGMGRVVGDGLFYTIFDIIVLSSEQGKKVGATIMNNILDWYDNLKNPRMLYLGANKGKEAFYEKFGFRCRPNEDVGAGMKYYKRKSTNK